MPPEESGAPASGTPPAAAPAPAPMPSEDQHQRLEVLNEDDAIIESLRAEHAAKADSEEPTAPAPKGARDGKGKFVKQPPTDPAQAKDTKAAAPAKAPAGSGTVFDSPEAALDAVTKAFETWDVDALAKATGKPKSFFEVNDAKWGAFREAQNSLRASQSDLNKRETALAARASTLESTRQEAAREFGAAIRAAAAYRDGDTDAFVTLVGELSGTDYDTAQKSVIQGSLAADPATKALRKKVADQERALADMRRDADARKASETKSKDQQQQDTRAQVVAAIDSEIGTHEAKHIKRYQDEIISRVRDSWSQSDNAYTLSFSDAADQLVAERDEEAMARGLQRAPARGAVRAASAPQIPSRSRAADARAPDGEPWMTEDMSDDAIIASIERDRKAGRLGKR